MVSWHPDIPFALLIIVLCIAMYAIPSLIEGVHKYRRGRDLARQIQQEHVAREFLDEDWKRRHGS